MSFGETVARAGAHTAATTLVTTCSAVAVNYATSGAHSVWVWAAVVVLAVCAFGISLWAQHSQSSSTPEPDSGSGVVLGDVKARGGLRVNKVRSSGTGVQVRRGKFGGDIDIEDVEAGGGASHP